MKRLLVTLATAFVAAGCARAATPASDSGVDGLVVLGPLCPVETEVSPCPDRPIEAAVLVMRPGSQEALRTVQSDAEGRFRVTLPPGTYLLSATMPAGASGETRPIPLPSKPVLVSVRPHEFARVTLRLDTGIRKPNPVGPATLGVSGDVLSRAPR